MDIKFSASFIKITFDESEYFAGKSLRMKGEPLFDGFDADLRTAEWLENHVGYAVSDSEIFYIREQIRKNNEVSSFKILFMGE